MNKDSFCNKYQKVFRFLGILNTFALDIVEYETFLVVLFKKVELYNVHSQDDSDMKLTFV